MLQLTDQRKDYSHFYQLPFHMYVIRFATTENREMIDELR